jgi:hypothetical protein
VLEVKVKLFIGAKKMAQLCSKYVGEFDSRGQFYQPYGTKRKQADSHFRRQQKYAQLY